MRLSGSGFFSLCSLLALGFLSAATAADPAAELGKFSAFENFDLTKVAGGKVLLARGPTLSFPRDLAVQAVYLVQAPLAKTFELHRKWDPTKTSDPKIYLHGDFSSKPAVGDFSKINSAPGNGAVRALVAATQKLPAKGILQLSNAEAQEYAKIGEGAGSGNLPPPVATFWSQILLQRAQAFAGRGVGGVPPYDLGSESVRVSDELSRLMKAQPKIRAQFHGLTDGIPSGVVSNYWELSNVDGQAVFSLGVVYGKEGAEGAQLIDLQYYASSGYCVLATLYQMWPVTVDNRPATLVWRGDNVASAALSELHGMERMGSGAAMMKEVQRGINNFQKDVAR